MSIVVASFSQIPLMMVVDTDAPAPLLRCVQHTFVDGPPAGVVHELEVKSALVAAVACCAAYAPSPFEGFVREVVDPYVRRVVRAVGEPTSPQTQAIAPCATDPDAAFELVAGATTTAPGQLPVEILPVGVRWNAAVVATFVRHGAPPPILRALAPLLRPGAQLFDAADLDREVPLSSPDPTRPRGQRYSR